MDEENDAIEEAGRWYRDVLIAVGQALHDVGTQHTYAGAFVASLARQGFLVERDAAAVSLGDGPTEGAQP